MGIWDKWVLGWANPASFNPGDKATHGRRRPDLAARPSGTEDGIKVNLPTKVVTLAEPHSGANMWWSRQRPGLGRRQPDPRRRRARRATDVQFWMWNNYVIEEDWDFGFVEVSDRRRHHVDRAEGLRRGRRRGLHRRRLRRPERPHGRLRRQEVRPHRRHRRLAARLRRPHAVRRQDRPGAPALRHRRGLRRARLVRRRLLASPTAAPTVWSDDVEGGANGWTATSGTFTGHRSAPAGSSTPAPRAAASTTWPSGATSTGSTRACKYAYDTTYSDCGPVEGREDQVQRPRHARLVPGHDVRRHNPVAGDDVRPAQHRLQGRPAPRRLALRPAAAHRRGGATRTRRR